MLADARKGKAMRQKSSRFPFASDADCTEVGKYN